MYLGSNVTQVGDSGWFYDKLAAFNTARPYLSSTQNTISQNGSPAAQRNLVTVSERKLLVTAFGAEALVELFDPSGRRIMKQNAAAGSVVSLLPIARGMYFAKIRKDGQTQTIKVNLN